MYGKLVAAGLVAARGPVADDGKPESITLAAFIDQYITARQIQKPNTLKNYKADEAGPVGLLRGRATAGRDYPGRLR